jgi:hypothetical protein
MSEEIMRERVMVERRSRCIPLAFSNLRAYSDWPALETTLLTCSVMDKLLRMVTPNTLRDLTRGMVEETGGSGVLDRGFLTIISADFDWLSFKLLEVAQLEMWANSALTEKVLEAGMSR